jgi:hypothetical protein
MFPILLSNYVTNGRTSYPIHFSQLSIGKIASGFKCPYFQDKVFGKFGAVFSFPLVRAIRANHIIHIVLTIAWFQMIGITTRRVITNKMSKQGIIRNTTVGKNVGYTMSQTFTSPTAYSTVTSGVFTCFPFPTILRVSNIHFRPKVIKGMGTSFVTLANTAAFATASNGHRSDCPKLLRTNGASLSHKNTSVNGRQGEAQSAIIAIAFNLLQRLLDAPRVFPALRGFSMPIIPNLSSNCEFLGV